MKLLMYSTIIAIILAVSAFGFIAMTTDPYSTVTSTKALFFTSMFVSVWGLLSLGIIAFRRYIGRMPLDHEGYQRAFLYGLYGVALITTSLAILHI